MNVTLHSQRLDSLPADLLVVGVERGQDSPALAQLDRRLHGLLRAELRHQRFIASDGQVVLFQTHGALPARHVLVVGLGNGIGPRPWYQLSHTITTRAQEVHATRAAVMVPQAHLSPSTLAILAEGAQLSAYRFDRLKSAAKRHPVRLRQLMMAAAQPRTAARQAMARARLSAAATCYARDLINLPAAVVTPSYLAAEARRIARQQRLRVRILTSPALRRAGMGAVLGVAQGSTQPPYFIELVYQPRPRARSRPSAPKGSRPTTPSCVALAGKGITFDSGGLSIKTAESMQSQKRDMAGGAAVLAVMSVIRDLEVPV